MARKQQQTFNVILV